jgi:hypothetical protein
VRSERYNIPAIIEYEYARQASAVDEDELQAIHPAGVVRLKPGTQQVWLTPDTTHYSCRRATSGSSRVA